MATLKRPSLICKIPNFSNAYLGQVTKFQGYSLFRFEVLSNLLAWRWKTPPPPPVMNTVKVNPNTFGLKCKNLPKCTKFCSTCKLEIAVKNFGLLTKICLVHWQIRGLKGSISGNYCVVYMPESLNSNFACGNRCTHDILLPIGPQQFC